MYSYIIYTTIISPTLNYIYLLQVHHFVITRQIYYSYILDIIILVSFTMFQIYDITSCDCSHVPFYCPRNKRNRKEEKREIKLIKSKKIKIKYKSSSTS